VGFNKRYIDKEKIVNAFKYNGATGVTDLYKADAIILDADSSMCSYIDNVMSKEESLEHKQNLIELYMMQLFEGLYPFK